MAGQTSITFDDLIPKGAAEDDGWKVISVEPAPVPHMPKDGWEVASTIPTSSASNISFDDLIPKQPQKLSQEYPTGIFKGIKDPKEYLRQLGLTARAGIEGSTKALSFPVNAVGSALAGTAKLIGAPRAAKYIEENLGLTGGQKAAQTLSDALGLPSPQNKTERIVQAGAQGVAGGVVGNPVSSSPIMAAMLPATNTSKAALLNAAVTSGMEASPETTLGVGGALAAATAGRKGVQAAGQVVDSALQKRTYDRMFKDNPRAAMDAEIISNLARAKAANGGALRPEQVSAVSDNYVKNLSAILKKAGLSTDDTALAISGRKALSAIDPVTRGVILSHYARSKSEPLFRKVGSFCARSECYKRKSGWKFMCSRPRASRSVR